MHSYAEARAVRKERKERNDGQGGAYGYERMREIIADIKIRREGSCIQFSVRAVNTTMIVKSIKLKLT